MRTYTEEEVTMAINVTAMISNQVGDPISMSTFLKKNVPEELHSKVIAACFGSHIASRISMFGPMAGMESLMEKLGKQSEKSPKESQKPKDISEMTPEELNAYIDQKLKEKREGK